jgi:phosphosulfolactate synthase
MTAYLVDTVADRPRSRRNAIRVDNPLSGLLDLPERSSKPRLTGLTMAIDTGWPTAAFIDAVESAASHLDVVKFGWGTAVVTADLGRKIDCLRANGVRFSFGGTLFEKFAAQGRVNEYLRACESMGVDLLEISNGTIDMSNTQKAAHIRACAADFTVISEVGFKDSERSLELRPEHWVAFIEEDLEAGATMVITETRESGRAGLCRPDGTIRDDLVDAILTSGVPAGRLLFEAPNKALQVHFIEQLGPEVNLGNVALDELIALETLRLGLRGDTLVHFEGERAHA